MLTIKTEEVVFAQNSSNAVKHFWFDKSFGQYNEAFGAWAIAYPY